LVREVKTT